MSMVMREGSALDVLLFGTGDEELVDIKCFRGLREDVTAEDIKREIHEGIMQHKMQPGRSKRVAPAVSATFIDVADFVKGLPQAA